MDQPVIVIDLRCLQEPQSAERGIPSFVRDIISQARAALAFTRNARVIGIIDPALHDVEKAVAESVDELRPHAYLPELKTGSVFLNPSPMTHDPIYIARLLLNPEIHKVAFVQDFTADETENYNSGNMAARLEHFTGIAWLKRYDVLTNPEHTHDRLHEAYALGEKAKPRSFGIGGRRPCLAMLTPLPPTHSGVADFSAYCAKSLRKLVDLTLFSPAATPTSKPLSELPHLSNRYDRVVSILGNSPHHNKIFDLHIRYGSACISHDSRLLHFFVGKFGATRTLKFITQELRRDVTEDEVMLWYDDETRREALCFGDLAKSAQPMIFHAKSSVTGFQSHYGVQARYLPFAIYRDWDFTGRASMRKNALRHALGFSDSELTIISLGFMAPVKGIRAAIQAIAILNQTSVRAKLIWVGKAEGNIEPYSTLAKSLGISEAIVFLDCFISDLEYRNYLLAADCGLQLRLGGSGNISGALQDCIAAGLPSVANNDLAESLNAPSYITRVADTLDPAEIAAALAACRDNHPNTSTERDDYAATHSMDVYARRLCEILELEV